jgi:hypothetical protein
MIDKMLCFFFFSLENCSKIKKIIGADEEAQENRCLCDMADFGPKRTS